jgi:molybdenum cofactor cytidylyltransferase
MNNVQLILLAAGVSRRMGTPKQLLPWGTTTLIEHQIKNLLNTNNSVSVILGAYADEIIKVIDKFPINVFRNENWENGMGTSIAYGVQQLLEKDSTADGILISLIDQPLLTTNHFRKMLNLFQSRKKQIIVSHAENCWSGAPVLFDRVYFDELLMLKGDEGAKRITNKYRNSVKLIDGGSILRDVDTHEAYVELLKEIN